MQSKSLWLAHVIQLNWMVDVANWNCTDFLANLLSAFIYLFIFLWRLIDGNYFVGMLSLFFANVSISACFVCTHFCTQVAIFYRLVSFGCVGDAVSFFIKLLLFINVIISGIVHSRKYRVHLHADSFNATCNVFTLVTSRRRYLDRRLPQPYSWRHFRHGFFFSVSKESYYYCEIVIQQVFFL